MGDLTVIYLTANKVPNDFSVYQRSLLKESIGNSELISISFVPMDFGRNLIQKEYSVPNIYKQILRGAKEANTEYIAIAEDDTLYSKEHFSYRPPAGKPAYNLNRWCIAEWMPHADSFYYLRSRPANGTMIAERDLVITELEERIANDPDFICFDSQKELRRSSDLWDGFYTLTPVICFHHRFSVDEEERNMTKRINPIRALSLPVFGEAKSIIAKFK